MQPQILQFLRQSDGYFSGEDLSRHLKISRAGIWKHIEDLREQGYEIEAVPHRGYRLLSLPDKLYPQEIQQGLKANILGQKIIYHETVSSTMDEAVALGIQGAPEGTVVCAESQTKGRGRLGRNWISPKGKGIYMSVILRPQVSLSVVSQLTLVCAVGVCEAIQSATNLPVKIKWPNDILINDQKVAGLLMELNAEMDRVRFVVLGVGLNVNTPLQQLPVGATSLKAAGAKDLTRIEIFQKILESLEEWYLIFQRDGFKSIMPRWKELSDMIGKRIKFYDGKDVLEGEAIGLAEDGGLLLRNDRGEVIKKLAGDMVLR
ncbi:MAG: biotin--[acetyl-CoA-carboxylase] ligase [Candidatus Omnitrophica bacterium]|nr:biotin--[acetyl-CoA-carboxylase] ligase [Candidatus Omnitrophota bacterium]